VAFGGWLEQAAANAAMGTTSKANVRRVMTVSCEANNGRPEPRRGGLNAAR
jgi:hypothetical protein